MVCGVQSDSELAKTNVFFAYLTIEDITFPNEGKGSSQA